MSATGAPVEPKDEAMPLDIRLVNAGVVGDLNALFCTDKGAAGCWCMWFIIPVKDYHAAGGAGNRASFGELAAASEEPMGLLAYRDGAPVFSTNFSGSRE